MQTPTTRNQIKAIETVYKGYRFRSRLEARWAVFFDKLGVKWEYEVEGFDLDGTWYLPDFWLPELQCYYEVKAGEPTEDEKKKAILLAIYTKTTVFIATGDVYFPTEESKGIYVYTSPQIFGECVDQEELTDRVKRCLDEFGALYYEEIGEPREDKSAQIRCFLPDPQPHITKFFFDLYFLDERIYLGTSGGKIYIHAPLEAITPRICAFIKKNESDLASALSCQAGWHWYILDIPMSDCGLFWGECPSCHKCKLAYSCGCLQEADKKWIEEQVKLKGFYSTGDLPSWKNKPQTKTPRLVAAYNAARQARFEHGEKP